LFLANLYDTCPFLIPCFYARKEGMSEDEYYRKLGYSYDLENKVEDQVLASKTLANFFKALNLAGFDLTTSKLQSPLYI
jgi:hypothetical protein